MQVPRMPAGVSRKMKSLHRAIPAQIWKLDVHNTGIWCKKSAASKTVPAQQVLNAFQLTLRHKTSMRPGPALQRLETPNLRELAFLSQSFFGLTPLDVTMPDNNDTFSKFSACHTTFSDHPTHSSELGNFFGGTVS